MSLTVFPEHGLHELSLAGVVHLVEALALPLVQLARLALGLAVTGVAAGEHALDAGDAGSGRGRGNQF